MMARREWLCDRRALVAGVLASFWGGTSLSVKAQPRFETPVVDRLTLQVLVDNAAFGPFLPNLTLPGLQVRRETGDRRPRMSRQALKAEFGLSVLGTSQIGDQTRRVLVDFGYTPDTLANNLSLLGVDPDQFDAAVLSHGHLDHYGGFAGLFAGRAAKDRHLPLYVGGEEAFCERVAMIASPPPVMGALDRAELAKAGMRAGAGCDAAKLSPGKREGQTPDDGEHELATCYLIKDLGLVVISCCSHRGVLNAVRQAQVLSGVDRVHAVVGGFHLVRPRTEDEARRTAAEFVKINPAYIIPMHCTGEVFIAEATRLMPAKVIRPYVGTQLVFDAKA
jgi:7,8-dihydropterin-6-yl-methyl-4-(beta-D-ribofuranosyl)aminobenzene 5'-phosphate synthase